VLPNPLSTVLATADVCTATPVHRMPHAITTTDLFWRGSGRAAFIKDRDTGKMSGGTIPTTGLGCP
jgi:hypothetical protein